MNRFKSTCITRTDHENDESMHTDVRCACLAIRYTFVECPIYLMMCCSKQCTTVCQLAKKKRARVFIPTRGTRYVTDGAPSKLPSSTIVQSTRNTTRIANAYEGATRNTCSDAARITDRVHTPAASDPRASTARTDRIAAKTRRTLQKDCMLMNTRERAAHGRCSSSYVCGAAGES